MATPPISEPGNDLLESVINEMILTGCVVEFLLEFLLLSEHKATRSSCFAFSHDDEDRFSCFPRAEAEGRPRTGPANQTLGRALANPSSILQVSSRSTTRLLYPLLLQTPPSSSLHPIHHLHFLFDLGYYQGVDQDCITSSFSYTLIHQVSFIRAIIMEALKKVSTDPVLPVVRLTHHSPSSLSSSYYLSYNADVSPPTGPLSDCWRGRQPHIMVCLLVALSCSSAPM